MLTGKPVAIVDIGSNSVRLVVYSGATRIPSILFNEKVMAGLGRDLGETGALSEAAQARALDAIARFRLLVREMGVGRTRVVATAAVRDASNGAAFLERIRAIGFTPEVLSGEEEAYAAGCGVLSAIPDADGFVGDLGGGSLELVELSGGRVLSRRSLPLGVLRLPPADAKGEAIAKRLRKAMDADLRRRARGRPFYLVGGSWRTLGRFDMLLDDHPLPVTHHHVMPPGRIAELRNALATVDARVVKALASSRATTLPQATALLAALVEELEPSALVVSAFGIREGLLYGDLKPEQRAIDPLIEAARVAGAQLGRFREHGDLLDDWIAPVFDDPPELARLRLAACLLSDVAWSAHPDFRAERGVDIALHGNWVGIDIPGRVMLGQALYSGFGGGKEFAGWPVAQLCAPDLLARAAQWGLAMRLGQRLSGGVAAPLKKTELAVEGGTLVLTIRRGYAALAGDPISRRLSALAGAMGLKAEERAV